MQTTLDILGVLTTVELAVYDFSPADGCTPFRHAVIMDGDYAGTVMYPTSNPALPNPWRFLTGAEIRSYQNGVAWRDPAVL